MNRSQSAPRTEGQLWDALATRLDAAQVPPPPTSDDLLRYAADPLAFVREVLGAEPWEAQQRILLSIRDHPRTTVRSSHGVGKTWTAACTALWWIYSHRPSLLISTAPTARQVESLLWAEINRLWHAAGDRPTSHPLTPSPPHSLTPSHQPFLPGRCLRIRLEASLNQTGMGLTTTEPERFAGWHCEHLLVIVDEASGVPDSLFEVLQGTLTSAHCRLLLIGNPTRNEGCFHRSHHTGDWHRLKISAYDTPNFETADGRRQTVDGTPAEADTSLTSSDYRLPSTVYRLPCPWLVTPEWVEARREEWGEDSDPFRVRVLGEFPHASSDALIRLEWIEAAEERGLRLTHPGAADEGEGQEWGTRDPDRTPLSAPNSQLPTPNSHDEVVLGVDVARYGDCETVVALRRGPVLTHMWAWQGADLMHTCGRIVALVREFQPGRLVVDAVGLGAGVVDRLREIQREGKLLQGCRIEAFTSGATPSDPEKHDSRRDEAYLALSHRLRTGDIAFADRWSTLTGQLCSLKYGFTSRGQLKVESKDDRRRRGESSPDWADAVALAFAPSLAPGFLPVALSSRRVVVPLMPPLRLPEY